MKSNIILNYINDKINEEIYLNMIDREFDKNVPKINIYSFFPILLIGLLIFLVQNFKVLIKK